MTVKGNSLFWLLRRSPGDKATLGGLQNKVLSVSRLDNGEALPFTQNCTRVQIANVPATDETGLWPALRIECDSAPVVYPQWLFSFARYDYTRDENGPILSSSSPHAKLGFHRQQEWERIRFDK